MQVGVGNLEEEKKQPKPNKSSTSAREQSRKKAKTRSAADLPPLVPILKTNKRQYPATQ